MKMNLNEASRGSAVFTDSNKGSPAGASSSYSPPIPPPVKKQGSTDAFDESGSLKSSTGTTRKQSYATVMANQGVAPAQPRKSLLATAGFATLEEDDKFTADML